MTFSATSISRNKVLYPGYFILGFFLLCYTNAVGQSVLGNSPLSRFGLGDMVPEQNVRSQGMGNTGIANPDPDFVNLMNPALLTFHKLVNLEVGLGYISKDMKDASLSHTGRGGGISYLGLTFPLTKKLVSNITLLPLSSVDYNIRFSDKDLFGDGRDFNRVLVGNGGLNKINFSLGYSVNNRLSVGISPSLIFGTINNNTTFGVVTPTATTSDQYAIYTNNYSMFDATGRAGFNYRMPLDTMDKFFFSFGGFFELGRDLSGTQLGKVDYYPLSYSTAFRQGDTVYSTNVKASYPTAIGFGISYTKLLSYTLAADIQYKLYEGGKFAGAEAPYKNTLTIGAGGEYTPNPYSKNYLAICTYRTGLNFAQHPLVLGGNQVNDFSVSFGVTAPIVRKEAKFTRPYLSAALIIGQRGNVSTNGLSENYIRASFSITLNDATWFRRYKHE